MRIKQLREQRAKLAADLRAIIDGADKAGRATLDADERAKFDAIETEIDNLKATIDRLERVDAEERSYVPAHAEPTAPGATGASLSEAEQRDAHNRSFSNFLRGGIVDSLLRGLFRRDEESRAQTVTTTAGGYLISQAFSNQLEIALKFFSPMLANAGEVFRTATGATMPWPTVNDTSQVGELLGINTAVASQDVTFGVVNLGAYKYSSKQVLVPVELMQDSAFDVDTLVARLLGERLGRILNQHFTTGTGSSQPSGIVTGAASGKVGTTGQTTSVIYDDLVDLIHSVDVAYRPGAKFMCADSSVKVIRKLKDSQNRPLWEPSLQAGHPDSILGYPLVINNDVATMAANAKSILFGDFSKYKIREVRDVTVMRLGERYMDALQVGFFAYGRWDGALVDAGTNPVKYYANSAT